MTKGPTPFTQINFEPCLQYVIGVAKVLSLIYRKWALNNYNGQC